MNYNFDEIHDRTHTSSKKWNPSMYKARFNGHTDLLPLWVADMDFKVSEGINKRLSKVVESGIFGYTGFDDEYYDAIIRWHKEKHNFALAAEDITYTPGVVTAVNFCLEVFTKENDAIIIQTPVYYPFSNAIRNNNRKLITSPLIESEPLYYTMDLEDFERKIIDNDVKMFILCSPHNPVGRVWTREELEKVAEICLKHNVLVISDEIHSDLLFFGNEHTPFMNISEEIAQQTITCTAVSKTFNLAGLKISNIIIKNKELRERYQKFMDQQHLLSPNAFAMEMVKGAYLESDDWYEQVKEYIEGNIQFAADYLEKETENLRMRPLQGTYLGWIDARKFSTDPEVLTELCEVKAKVAFDFGHWFGEEGNGFLRINLACPRSIVAEALSRLKKAVEL
ncbi:MalY/PatB family protein [Maridesulfovibrio bastinii]|uniref:MalY/PatB family protein n=1 Tax=Maridesulfovibrio bastinii TaxID=47157 RepID=UPI00041910F0|nr:MalY/PatB family protein [Maridesulfovibrio bastinii]